jgi:hypothetical protein
MIKIIKDGGFMWRRWFYSVSLYVRN